MKWNKIIVYLFFLLVVGCQTKITYQKETFSENVKQHDLEPIIDTGLYYDLKQHSFFSSAKFNSFYISEDESVVVFSVNLDGEYFHIYQKNPYKKTFTQVTTGKSNNIFPALSSDKEKITFISDRDGWPNVYIVDMDKTFLVAQVTNDTSEKFLPRFSPDNTKILYTAKENGKFALIIVDLTTKIKTFLGEGIGFSWSRDNKIMFMKPNESKANAIWAIDAEKLKVSQIVYDTEKFIVFPSSNFNGDIVTYSKTKQQIKFNHILRAIFPNVTELWVSVINDVKRSEYQIINDGYTNFNPILSGERLYFISDRNGGENLWSIKIAIDIKKEP